MKAHVLSRKEVFLTEAQTLFVTAKPQVRYPLAVLFASIAAYMMLFVPHADMNYVLGYAAIAGLYAWEISAALAVMFALLGFFKLLAMLPFGLAVIVVMCIFIYAGV